MKLPTSIDPDGYFLSPDNPLATADQRDLEQLAMRIVKTPRFVEGRKMAALRWKGIVGNDSSEEAWARFESFLDECAFGNALKAVNGDSQRPKVVRLVMPPHDWFGMSVPGSRFGGGPGIDQSYGIIPIDFGSRYELTGQWIREPPADQVFTLMGNSSMTMTLGNLDISQLTATSTGTFQITLDPSPAGARPNHMQTRPGSQYLFLRDCRSDWKQPATAMRIRCLDPPTLPSWTEDQMAERAVQLMLEDIPWTYSWMRHFQNLEANVLGAPFAVGSLGGLVTQLIVFGRIVIADDDALVVTIDPAGAAFHDIQLNDYWFNAVGDYVSQTSSFNNEQSEKCSDGSIVYVISKSDPGVRNWLNPVGLTETLLVNRWQQLPAATAGGRSARISGRLLKLHQLRDSLGNSVRWIDQTERAEQLSERRSTYELRLIDR